MKPQTVFAAIIMPVVVGGWIHIFTASQRSAHPELAYGCFAGSGPLSGVEMVVAPNGFLHVQGQDLKFEVDEDKEGLSIVPEQRILFDRNLPKPLVIDSGSSKMIRLSADHQTLSLPGDQGGVLQRHACPA